MLFVDWFLRKNIRFNLFFMFMFFSIVPLLISIAQNYFVQKNNLAIESQARLEGMAEERARLVDNWFADNLNLVHSFSNNPLLSSGNPDEIVSSVANIQKANSNSKNVFFLDTKGDIVSTTSQNIKGNFSEKQYFKKAMEGNPVVSDVLVENYFKQPSIVFAVPVYNSRKIFGVLVQSVGINELHQIVDVSAEGKNLEGFLVNAVTGDYVVPPDRLTRTEQAEMRSYLRGKIWWDTMAHGNFKYIAGGKDKLLLTYKAIKTENIVLFITQDEQEAIMMANGKGLRNSIIITLLLIVILTFAVTWLTKKIAYPLEQISLALREMAAGNIKQHICIPVANQEIRVVCEDINTLSEELFKAKNTIAEQIMMLEAKQEEMTSTHKELLASNASLEHMANRDQLTGIYNRRYLQNRLQEEIKSALSSESNLSFILFDIDYFKKINDLYGHQVGDQVLVKIAALVQKTIRKTDVFARFGGEEFVILALGARIDEGFNIAEKVRHVIEEDETDSGKIRVTVSAGVSTLEKYRGRENVNQISDLLLNDADKNMYEAKTSGRNRVVANSMRKEVDYFDVIAT